METCRIPTDILEKVNSTLKLYEGTKNYHNFTSKKNFLDPSAKRLTSGEPFLSPQVIEFLTLKVKGKSFTLHQIRKMVGVGIAVVTGIRGGDNCSSVYRGTVGSAEGARIGFGTRSGEDGIHKPLNWEELEPEIEEFVEKYIYATEQKESQCCSG